MAVTSKSFAPLPTQMRVGQPVTPVTMLIAFLLFVIPFTFRLLTGIDTSKDRLVPVTLAFANLFIGAAGFVVNLVARNNLSKPTTVIKFGVPRALIWTLFLFVEGGTCFVAVAAPLATFVDRLYQLFVGAA